MCRDANVTSQRVSNFSLNIGNTLQKVPAKLQGPSWNSSFQYSPDFGTLLIGGRLPCPQHTEPVNFNSRQTVLISASRASLFSLLRVRAINKRRVFVDAIQFPRGTSLDRGFYILIVHAIIWNSGFYNGRFNKV